MRVYRNAPGRLWLIVGVLVVASCTPSGGDRQTPATTAPAATTTLTTEPPLLLGPGIVEGIVRLGAVLPLSGSRAPFGRAVLAGHQAYWDYVNLELGGVEGFTVEVLAEDSAYETETAAAAAETLADRTLALSAGLGSPITEAVLPVAQREELLAAAGAQILAWAAEPSLLLDVAVATYPHQVSLGVRWIEQSGVAGGAPTAGLIYQEGLYGEDCRAGFESAVTESSFGVGPALEHSLAQTEFSELVATQQAQGVDLLILCTVPEATLAIVATAELLAYSPTFLATAQSYDQALPGSLGGDGGEQAGLSRLEKLYVTGALEAAAEPAPGLLLYQDNLARAGLEARQETWYTYWGYTQAATMHLVLQEAFEGRDLTRPGLRSAVSRLEPVDLGFGAGPVGFDQGVPTAVDAVGRPVAFGNSLFGLVRVSDFVRLDD